MPKRSRPISVRNHDIQQFQPEQFRIRTSKNELDNKFNDLTKHYPHPGDQPCIDSRIYINFTQKQLIQLVHSFAYVMGFPRIQESERNKAPFFGVSESCFREFIVYALNARAAFVNAHTTAKELEHSLSGKTLIRNLLHTVSTLQFSIMSTESPFVYATDPEIKACYIRLFREACELFIGSRYQPVLEQQTLWVSP